jgi:hypothetical protein
LDDELGPLIDSAFQARLPGHDEGREWLLEVVKKDFDGAWFFDYFRGTAMRSMDGTSGVLLQDSHEFRIRALKEVVEQGLVKFKEDPHIQRKYAWALGQYNAAANERGISPLASDQVSTAVLNELRPLFSNS